MKNLKRFVRAAALTVSLCIPASATAVFTEPALAAGSQYRIAFVTSTTRDGSSTVIGDYNTFVDNAANAGGSLLAFLSATWSVIGSTQTVGAATNIGGVSTVPIYLLDGTLVATGTADLFDGTISNGIDLDEKGNLVSAVQVMTGSNADGTPDAFNNWLGNGFSQSRTGFTTSTDSSWLHFAVQNNTSPFVYQFYGISSVLVTTGTTGPVPEPGTIALTLAGIAVLAGIKRRTSRS